MFEEILKKVKTQESEIDDIKNILSTMKKSLVNTIDDSEEQLKVELNKFSKLNA